jgi:hypothetical protein
MLLFLTLETHMKAIEEDAISRVHIEFNDSITRAIHGDWFCVSGSRKKQYVLIDDDGDLRNCLEQLNSLVTHKYNLFKKLLLSYVVASGVVILLISLAVFATNVVVWLGSIQPADDKNQKLTDARFSLASLAVGLTACFFALCLLSICFVGFPPN